MAQAPLRRRRATRAATAATTTPEAPLGGSDPAAVRQAHPEERPPAVAASPASPSPVDAAGDVTPVVTQLFEPVNGAAAVASKDMSVPATVAWTML